MARRLPRHPHREGDIYAHAENALRIDYDLHDGPGHGGERHQPLLFQPGRAGNGDILSHEIMIDADRFTPVDDTLIPTANFVPVAGAPFDFRTPTAIGARITSADEQIKFGKGVRPQLRAERHIGNAQAGDTRGRRRRRGGRWRFIRQSRGFSSTRATFLTGASRARAARSTSSDTDSCLETQHFPNSPNTPSFHQR